MRILAPLLAVLTAAIVLAGALDIHRRPYKGFAVRDDRVAAVDAGSPADKAGLQVGDRIQRVFVNSPGDTGGVTLVESRVSDLGTRPRGTMAGLLVTPPSGSPARVVSFELTSPPATETWRLSLSFLVALVCLGTGYLTWHLRPGPMSRAFLVICVALAMILRPPLPPRPEWLAALEPLLSDLAAMALAAALVEFVIRLPAGRLSREARPFVMAAWLLALALGAAEVALQFHLPVPEFAMPLASGMALVFVIGCLLGALARFVLTLARTSDRADALRLRVVMWGGLLGLAPITLILILRNLTSLPVVAGENFAVLAVAFLPLSWMYAIVRHRIFDIRLLMRRGAVAFVFTTILAAVWLGAVAWLGPRLDPVTAHPLAAVVGLLVAALLFTGTRHYVQALVDRTLFSADLSRRRRLEELSGRLSGFLDSERLTESLVAELDHRLGAIRSALLHPATNGRGDAPPSGALLAAPIRQVLESVDRPATRGDLLERAPRELRAVLAERLAECNWELFVPIRDGQSLHAVAAFELARRAGGLDSRELAVLRRISRSASEALAQARRHEDERERERLQGELDVARSIQRHLLPDEPPLAPLVELAAVTLPGEAVGGDAHDYSRLPDGRIGVAVSDVAGKGIPAAILMASVQASFRALSESGLEPGPLMAALNRRVLEINEPDRFVCFFFATIDPNGSELSFVNAGIEPPILVRDDGGAVDLDGGGLVLGVIPGATYESRTVPLQAGDVLLVFSDGLVDARDPERAPSDRARLVDLVRRSPGLTAERYRELILRESRLNGEGTTDDDVTLMVARFY
jgi:sigma-B regulation protein RsbU (phosphoserine phosphatase)